MQTPIIKPDNHDVRESGDNGVLSKDLKASTKAYISGNINRRTFLSALTAAGWSASAAGDYSTTLSEDDSDPFEQSRIPSHVLDGTGGAVIVEQLKHCGVRFVLANPSSGTGPLFDAMVNREDMVVMKGLQEGTLIAMADGYSKAGGNIPFVTVARTGYPNTLAQMYNAFKDRTPMVIATDQLEEGSRGQFSIQEVDDLLESAKSFTRWRWECRRPDKLAEDVRRAFKFAGTPPTGPVFLSIPTDMFHAEGVKSEIIDQRYFNLDLSIRPAASDIEDIAWQLLEAKRPIIYAGPEICRFKAEAEVVALAELLSFPVAQEFYGWGNAFPTDHPLYLGFYQANMRYPADVDFILNIGGRIPALPDHAILANASLDIDTLGRLHPAALNCACNVRLFARDLRKAIQSMATEKQLGELSERRLVATKTFTDGMRASRERVAKSSWDDSPIALERLAMELENALDTNTTIVHIVDSGILMLNYLSFGAGKKEVFTSSGQSLGWSIGAAIGAKLAKPERPVVALMGDGDFLFGGSQGLWTAQRHEIPITVIILNNRSYDNERKRMWSKASRQAELNRDMTCYIGDPDVEYLNFAEAYGIKGEKIVKPDDINGALTRAMDFNRNGKSYLLDILVARRGLGADSTWFPEFSLADERKRKI